MSRGNHKKMRKVVRTDALASRRVKKLKMLADATYGVVVHPITWDVVSLILAAVTATGRISMILSDALLLLASLLGCFGITRTRLRPLLVVALCLLWVVVLALIAWWINFPTPTTVEPASPTPTTVEPASPTPTTVEPASPTLVMVQVPLTGNLRQRTIALSDEIMIDLYRHGWAHGSPVPQKEINGQPVLTQMPTTAKEKLKWARTRSDVFRFCFLAKVCELRDEYSQFHLRDQHLEDVLKYQLQGANFFGPMDIEMISESLRHLADQLPNQP